MDAIADGGPLAGLGTALSVAAPRPVLLLGVDMPFATVALLVHVRAHEDLDPDRLRPSDVEILIGDSSKFRADTGWAPRIPFDQTVQDLLDYWREVVARRKRPVPAPAST